MTLNDIPLFAMLKGKMAYVSQRQTVIAQNVANADTPGYAPRDMKAVHLRPGDEGRAERWRRFPDVSLTNAGHIASSMRRRGGGGWGDRRPSLDSEVRLDGNHVVLEDQMMKTEPGQDGLRRRGRLLPAVALQLLKTAMKKPGS